MYRLAYGWAVQELSEVQAECFAKSGCHLLNFWQNEDYIFMKTTSFSSPNGNFFGVCCKLFPSVISSWRSILKHIETKQNKCLHMYIIHSWWQVEFDWRFPKAYFYGGGQFQVTLHWWFIRHQTCLTLLSCQLANDDASKETFCNIDLFHLPTLMHNSFIH